MSNLLEIENLSKSFGNKVVLRDVSFNVPSGSIVDSLVTMEQGNQQPLKQY